MKIIKISKVFSVLVFSFVSIVMLSHHVIAQEKYPSRPIKLINNFPPGGPSDIFARSIGHVMQEKFKQPVIVENKAGAAGNIGADFVAKSPADGYTVLFGIDTTFTINPHIYKSMPFKNSDLKVVAIMASSGLLIAVNSNSDIKTLKALIDAGKAKPISFSSAGIGSPGHMDSEILGDTQNIKINHIPYKGNTPAVTAIVSGEVEAGILATPGMLPFVQAGKLTPLGVTSKKRSQLLPEIKTVAELGHKDLELEVMYLVMVPQNTPEPLVKLLQNEILAALRMEDIRKRMAGLDLFYEGLTGEAANKKLNQISQKYERLVKLTDMKAE